MHTCPIGLSRARVLHLVVRRSLSGYCIKFVIYIVLCTQSVVMAYEVGRTSVGVIIVEQVVSVVWAFHPLRCDDFSTRRQDVFFGVALRAVDISLALNASVYITDAKR